MPVETLPPLRLKIEFSALELGRFARFLLGLRSLACRALIISLKSRSADEQEARHSIRLLERSFHSFIYGPLPRIVRYNPYISDPWIRVPEKPFEYPAVSYEFDSWADDFLNTSDLLVERVEEGSIIVVIGMASLLSLAEYPYNYSVMKDIVTLMMSKATDAISGKNAAPSSVGHVPKPVVDLAKDPKVKRLEYSWDQESGHLFVER